MSEIIQSYTGTLDNLNMSGLVFSLNMSGAQSTLGDHKFALRSITFTKPSSSGYQDPVYLNLWEMKEGESTYTYITSSTNASNTTTSSDGVWNFTGVELDIDSKYYITVTASPSSVMSELILVRSRVYSVPSGSGVGSHNYINNYNPPAVNFNWMPVMSLTLDETIEGSINISKGYYNNGTYKIITQGTTASLTDLKQNQTVGCKNDLYMTTASGTVAPYITSLAAPTGTFDATVKLDTPVYLDWTKEYIAGGAEIAPEWSFSNGGILTDYTLVGTPTIDSDYIASNFSSRNAVAATVTLDTSKPWELRTKITTGSNVSTRQKFVGGVNGVDCKVPTLEFRSSRVYVCIPNTSGNGWLAEVDTSYVVSSSTSYWFKYGWTGTTYFLQVSTDGTTYSSIYSWNSSTAAYHSDSYKVGFGNDLYMSNDQFPFYGSIDLKLCSFDIEGTLAWAAVFADEKKIVTQKALAYDSVADKTYWYPQETAVTLVDVKAAQTVNMKNHLYCTNTTGSSTAYFTFCEGTPSGVTEYYQQPEYVWLNSSKDTILGIQEEPDEIELEETGITTTNYTVTGSPTITDDYIATFSSGSLINPNTQWTYSGSPWAVELKFTTPSSYAGGNGVCLFRWGDDDCMIFLNSGGYVVGCGWSSYPRVAVSLNTTYWLKVEYDGTNLNMYLSTTGEYPVTPTDSSSSPAYWPSNNVSTVLGAKWAGSETFNGSIDLKEVRWYSNGTKVWEAVSVSSPTSVETSQDHYWTYLQGVTYDAQGSTLAISGMSPSALTGHILVDTSGTLSYSEDTDISQSALLPTKAYTGYDVTFTDNTYTAIQSVDKVGTKCRIYSSNIDAETGSQLFVALPVTEYEEGFEGGNLPYKSVVQSLLGLKTPLEYTTTDSFVVTTTPGGFVDYYNPTEDKFYVYETGIYTGFRALSYSGDAYILDSTGA